MAEQPERRNNRSPGGAPSGLNRAQHQRVSGLLGVLLLIGGLGTIATMHSPVGPAVGSSIESVGLRIDPNSAPWWELTIIPGVGETTARRIVSFRSENSGAVDGPFRRPADLQAVHRIGPKTAARMAPYLAFPDL
ncbi:MAG: helix-hairpin-helix domain-containing protein [Planctomycetes bacterium]|nr:helix-hairpin-helix domain-containing protein [Planctomycetota bacterium]